MKNLDADAYKKVLTKMYIYHQLRKNDRNDKTEYWLTSIKEIINWLPFFDIMEFIADRIDND